MRSGDAAGGAELPAARFDQVVEEHRENMIGRDEFSIAIYDSVAIGIAVGGKTGDRFLFAYCFAQWREIFIRGIGAMAVEDNITVVSNRRHRYSVIDEDAIEPSRAAAVNCVADVRAFGGSESLETHEFGKTGEIRGANMNVLEISRRAFIGSNEFFGRIFRSAGFDVVSYFGKSWATVRAGEFEAVVRRRIVAGRDIHRTIQFAANELVGDCWRGRRTVAE